MKNIYDNYENIIVNEHHKIATLTNIQNTINSLTSKIYFYSNQTIKELNDIVENFYESDQSISATTIQGNYKKLRTAIDMRSMFVLLEYSITQTFDKYTTNNIKANLHKTNQEFFQPFIDNIAKVSRTVNTTLIHKATTLSKQEELKSFQKELSSLSTNSHIRQDDKSVSDAFLSIENIDKNGMECYVFDDGVYVEV